MVRFENVSKIYPTSRGAVKSLDALSLEVKAGEFIALRGPSGCGKTTLLLTAGGMLRPTSGRVTVDGQDLYALSSRERAQFRARKIGFVFQMFHLVPYLNAVENVLLAANPATKNPDRDRAARLLAQLGMTPRADHKPADLSTGERQRTAIARALLNEPKLILADEPTGNLDPENAAEVFRHLQEFHRAGGTVLVVTHGTTADAFADRVVEMRAGAVHNGGLGNGSL
ncbi:MAG: ABC transporter ATP-binding protein [Verrucomicrobia bacterium]|nr:ABC transporter ATP-binding protein [Verrucomicrobiota bacterium]